MKEIGLTPQNQKESLRRNGHAFVCDRCLVQAGITELAFAESREKRPLELYTQVHWVGPWVAGLAGKDKSGQLPCTAPWLVGMVFWMELQKMHEMAETKDLTGLKTGRNEWFGE